MVPCARLQVRRGMPCKEQGPHQDRTDSTLRMRTRLLLWMYIEQPPTCTLRAGEEVGQEMRGRLRDRQLDISQYEGMPEL